MIKILLFTFSVFLTSCTLPSKNIGLQRGVASDQELTYFQYACSIEKETYPETMTAAQNKILVDSSKIILTVENSENPITKYVDLLTNVRGTASLDSSLGQFTYETKYKRTTSPFNRHKMDPSELRNLEREITLSKEFKPVCKKIVHSELKLKGQLK